MQINNNFQKNANISMVAHLLWKEPGISRVEIARQLDLYRSTVSNIINTLIDHGVVFEDKEGVALPQGGRKPICLGLNEKFGCVLGLEIQPSYYHVVVINMVGTVLFSTKGTLPESPFEDMVDEVIQPLLPEITKIGLPLLGICVGLPGIIDSGKGIIVSSDQFHLYDQDFSSIFSVKYGVPVLIENDANCLAWMELANNRGKNMKNFICLYAEYHHKDSHFSERTGMGVGMGIAIGGSVYSGSTNAAGEFVSISWKNTKNVQTGLSVETMQSIETDPLAFEEWVIDLFSSFVPVISVLDPEAIFAHGELARYSEQIRKIVLEKVPQFDSLLKRSSCNFIFGEVNEYVVSTGAALMFFQYLFSVPGNSTGEMGTSIDWDTVFSLTDSVR